MGPQTILIIRHGEKPEPDGPEPGLTPEGRADPQSLVVRGWQRAGAWAALFGGYGGPTYPAPARLYASDPTRSPEADRPPSQRPAQTAMPLAARLGLPLRTAYAQGEETALADDLCAQDGISFVSWEHKLICAALLPALLGDGRPDIPSRWDKARFDVVFRLDRPDRAAPWAFRQLMPCLLGGDSAAPMPL